MGDFWTGMFMIDAIMILCIIPLTLYFYESDDEQTLVKKIQ